MYNDAKARINGLYFPSLAELGYTDAVLTSSFYALEDLPAIQEYSDLHYRQIDLSVGGTYNVTTNLFVTAQAGFQQFIDDAPYVYGDQDGTVYSGSLGIGYRF
ncbi:hypothetical protein GURASL_15160 [Geotalea uraniireducens]|uniref:Uncharacterized protein n=3 Tax=Geotalea uraniireducens TaxID=351604 RepID=A0ABM8EJF1_9BACT|nr:hypothetical protein GURASL_15160 [Geotalea uraniireducens]